MSFYFFPSKLFRYSCAKACPAVCAVIDRPTNPPYNAAMTCCLLWYPKLSNLKALHLRIPHTRNIYIHIFFYTTGCVYYVPTAEGKIFLRWKWKRRSTSTKRCCTLRLWQWRILFGEKFRSRWSKSSPALRYSIILLGLGPEE